MPNRHGSCTLTLGSGESCPSHLLMSGLITTWLSSDDHGHHCAGDLSVSEVFPNPVPLTISTRVRPSSFLPMDMPFPRAEE